MSSHPGVTLHTAIAGGTIKLAFRNPFNKGKQQWKSAKTDNGKAATALAEYLSQAIHSPLDRLRNDYPEIIYDMLEVRPLAKKIEDARGALIPGEVLVPLPDDPSKPQRLRGGRYITVERPAASLQAAKEILDEAEAMRQHLEFWKSKAIAAETKLGRKISAAEAAAGPRPLKRAMAEFMSPENRHRTKFKASGQSRYNVGKWVERFVKDAGDDVDANRVTPERVIEHLEKFKTQAKLSDIYCYVCKFLVYATHGQFERDAVREWFDGVKEQRELKGDDVKEWFHLEKPEAKKLIKQLEKDFGQYWSDAATLQYGCGFRPEELPLLRVASVKGSTIYVTPPAGRRTKNKRSRKPVNVPLAAMPALKRRLEAAGEGETFFPYSQSGCELAPHLAAKRTKDDARRDIWPAADDHEFSEQYRKRLKAAAAKIMEAERAEKVDSRTLRRTCAKELLDEHKSYELAAAVLRNNPETLRKHYAEIEPSDVSTER